MIVNLQSSFCIYRNALTFHSGLNMKQLLFIKVGALDIKGEIRLSVDLCVHFKRLHPDPFS